MDHDETGCQAAREGPILCLNNCGFFGSVATMNMCSKCYKDTVLKQEQAKIAQTSIENIVNRSSSTNDKEPILVDNINLEVKSIETKTLNTPESSASITQEIVDVKPKNGPSRCTSCNKRVGLTGFSCRCGNMYCSTHRYSDKHECTFDYRATGRDSIAKANPVIKAEKLDKI